MRNGIQGLRWGSRRGWWGEGALGPRASSRRTLCSLPESSGLHCNLKHTLNLGAMKLIAPCHKCTVPPGPAVMMIGEIDNDLLAICTCPNGHRQLVHQAHSAPEIVYSAGIRAFLAGFYSESVVTLTSALERGYELFVKVFLRASGRSETDIDEFWKELRNSSERQLGAFCVMYFFCNWHAMENIYKTR